jgi:hypothetical protein
MRIFDDSEEIAIYKAHISLVEMMGALPVYVLHLMDPQKLLVSLEDVLVLYEIFVCQDEDRARNLLTEFSCAERVEPRIEENNMGNLVF